jgi:hypothetical protein
MAFTPPCPLNHRGISRNRNRSSLPFPQRIPSKIMRLPLAALCALFLTVPVGAAVAPTPNSDGTPAPCAAHGHARALVIAEEAANGTGWKQFLAATRNTHAGPDDLALCPIGTLPAFATWALMVGGFALAGIRLRRSPLRF